MKKPLRAINDLRRHIRPLSYELMGAINTVIVRGWFVLGQELEKFEKAFGDYCGGCFCVGVGSGTDALELSLRALSLETGQSVLTVANAGMYATNAILAAGAKPRYVDIDSVTNLVDIDDLRLAIAHDRPSAMIITHLYGRMVEMSRVLKIAEKTDVKVIEDCAQAHGARLKGKVAGSFGQMGCFSFYPTKNLGAIGDGGAIITSDDRLSKTLKSLRQYGWESKYMAVRRGGRNSRLDEIQAVVLNCKLKYLDGWNARRREIATLYNRLITHPKVICPLDGGEEYVAHLYVVRTPFRDSLRSHLQDRLIPTDIHYPVPDYRQTNIAKDYPGIIMQHTDQACAEVLTLPCFPEMTDDEVVMVAEAVNQWPL